MKKLEVVLGPHLQTCEFIRYVDLDIRGSELLFFLMNARHLARGVNKETPCTV